MSTKEVSPFEVAKYLTLPELSPYTTIRYGLYKEIFRHLVEKLEAVVDPKRSYRYADIACANGELFYFLVQKFPHWEFYGFDYTDTFIETARTHEWPKNVHFEVKDLFDVRETYDIVSFLGTMSTFPDATKPIEQLLKITQDGGLVLADGYYNKYEVEVRTVWCDNSTPEGKGKWRVDWNRPTQSGLREFLAGKCKSVEFEEVEMRVELPRDPTRPHINAWTFKTAEGKNILTNGAGQIITDTMMIIHK